MLCYVIIKHVPIYQEYVSTILYTCINNFLRHNKDIQFYTKLSPEYIPHSTQVCVLKQTH